MSQRRSHLFVLLVSGLLALASQSSQGASAEGSSARQALQVENHFTTAEETLRYFLARDLEGFYWTGFLEQERREFTTWKHGVAHDSFYLAKSFSLRSLPQESSQTRQVFEVQYELDSVLDAAGTRSPPMEPVRTVRFELQKDGSRWKVAAPDARGYVPVLLQSKVGSMFLPK